MATAYGFGLENKILELLGIDPEVRHVHKIEIVFSAKSIATITLYEFLDNGHGEKLAEILKTGYKIVPIEDEDGGRTTS